MLNVTFSDELFTQIGGTNWITRPGKFDSMPSSRLATDQAKSILPQGEVLEETVVGSLEQQNVNENLNSVIQDNASEQNQTPVEVVNIAHVNEGLPVLSVVVIGAGLESIWQNEESLAWQLWQNIMKAFGWDENQVVFFDTEHLVTEDAIFSTMEEVIDLGVEWVLTMDEEHEISEQLAEGVQVISVSDFEQMLSDPYAKQSFYHSIINLGIS